MATTTFYPDAAPGSTSVDGYTRRTLGVGSGESWATITAGAGNSSNDSNTSTSFWQFTEANTAADEWEILMRSFFLFDTSSLPDTDTIDSATFSVYAKSKADAPGDAPDMNIYSASPASDTALVDADFSTGGTTEYATTLSYASITTSAYNDFTLNATGLAAIDATGITKFCGRNANYDVAGVAPANHDANRTTRRVIVSTADETGTSQDPKLVVTHSSAGSLRKQRVIMF